jgi:ankyrin repeat protein
MSSLLNNQLRNAALDGDTEAVNRLLGQGAKVGVADRRGTPLMIATAQGHLDTVRALLSAGASTKTSGGNNALQIAVVRGRDEILETLLKSGAQVDGKDNRGETALMWAAQLNRAPIAEVLLTYGADVHVQNSQGQTALMCAADSLVMTADAARVLINAGASLDAQDQQGNTALMLASRQDSPHAPEAVMFLLDEGADTTLVNRKGETAEDVATGDAKKVLVAHRERQVLRQAAGVGESEQEPTAHRRKM